MSTNLMVGMVLFDSGGACGRAPEAASKPLEMRTKEMGLSFED
jgi:hypothetical protein